MTIADSPHLQRFTWTSIHTLLAEFGFEVIEARGAILVCGPFSDLLLTGVPRAIREPVPRPALPGRASDYYIVARKR